MNILWGIFPRIWKIHPPPVDRTPEICSPDFKPTCIRLITIKLLTVGLRWNLMYYKLTTVWSQWNLKYVIFSLLFFHISRYKYHFLLTVLPKYNGAWKEYNNIIHVWNYCQSPHAIFWLPCSAAMKTSISIWKDLDNMIPMPFTACRNSIRVKTYEIFKFAILGLEFCYLALVHPTLLVWF